MKISEDPINLDYHLNSTVQKLWSALVEIDQMKKWFFDNIPDFKAELGFKTKFAVHNENRTFTHLWTITEVVPEKKITYNWRYEEYPGDSQLTFSLIPMKEGVKLNVYIEVIEDFPDDIPEFNRDSCIGGWEYFINQRLRGFLENN